MDENLRRLESAMDALAGSVSGLEARVAALEGRKLGAADSETRDEPPSTATHREPAAGQDVAPRPSTTVVLTAIGRTFLILAGAFLLRDLTDRGTVPQVWGIGLGLAYSLVWIILADRAGGAGKKLMAGFYGLSAVLIAYPLIWETTTKLQILTPGAAAAAIVGLTAAALVAAWRQRLRVLAWAFTLAALLTVLSLHLATDRRILFTTLLILLGLSTVWLAYGRRWWGPQWVVAPVANAAVVQLTLMAAGAGGSGGTHGLSTSTVQVVAVCLVVVYLGSFAVRTLVRQRDVTFFEVLQSAGALLVGFGGAVHVARSAGSGGTGLGVAALIAAASCYAVAFAFVRRRLGRGRNFFFYSSLALVLAFVGSPLVVHGGGLSFLFGVLAVAAAILGGRFDRVTVRFHSAAYAIAAALVSGLLATAVAAFAAGADRTWAPPGTSAIVALVLLVAAYVTLAGTQRGRPPRARRIPRFVVAIVLVIGAGGLLATVLVRASAGAEGADPATVAVLRTGILALAAIGLAALSRQPSLAELAWLVYPILIVSAAKLLIEDLRNGPATLTIACLLYGTALILAPRLRKRPRQEVEAG